MRLKSFVLVASTVAGSSILLASTSFAFCGVIKKTASGKSQAAATAKANNAGLVEVRKLEKNYGASNVTYKPAKLTCVGGGSSTSHTGKVVNFPMDCTITQSFCVKN
jgi:hypothetical protein